MIISQKRIEAIRRLHLEDKSEMNKSHITDEQVDRAIAALFPGWDEHNRKRFWPRIRQALEAAFPDQQPSGLSDERFARCVQIYKDKTQVNGGLDLCAFRRAIDAAFPEPGIQELLFDEERSARHDDPHQPAAFGPLIVTEEMAEQINYAKDIREALQSFVDRHSIKPIAFADRMPDDSQSVLIWDNREKFWCASTSFHCALLYPELTHWLPASALPIPEPTVDAKESAWNLYRVSNEVPNGATLAKQDFIAGYEAGQAGGKQP